MTAVVNGTTRLGRIVHSAEILPFTSTHLGTCGRGARRCVSEEGDNQIIGFHGEETAKFVEPKWSVDTSRRGG